MRPEEKTPTTKRNGTHSVSSRRLAKKGRYQGEVRDGERVMRAPFREVWKLEQIDEFSRRQCRTPQSMGVDERSNSPSPTGTQAMTVSNRDTANSLLSQRGVSVSWARTDPYEHLVLDAERLMREPFGVWIEDGQEFLQAQYTASHSLSSDEDYAHAVTRPEETTPNRNDIQRFSSRKLGNNGRYVHEVLDEERLLCEPLGEPWSREEAEEFSRGKCPTPQSKWRNFWWGNEDDDSSIGRKPMFPVSSETRTTPMNVTPTPSCRNPLKPGSSTTRSFAEDRDDDLSLRSSDSVSLSPPPLMDLDGPLEYDIYVTPRKRRRTNNIPLLQSRSVATTI